MQTIFLVGSSDPAHAGNVRRKAHWMQGFGQVLEIHLNVFLSECDHAGRKNGPSQVKFVFKKMEKKRDKWRKSENTICRHIVDNYGSA